uniref:Uncharacterized protein n=1 Tax=Anguilla anguilla TaxID=7936 RepID=A0A0E9SLM6_ANGAN
MSRHPVRRLNNYKHANRSQNGVINTIVMNGGMCCARTVQAVL